MAFPKEKHARWAKHIAEEMIKMIYAENTKELREQLLWLREALSSDSTLCERYLKYREQAAGLPAPAPAVPFGSTALDYLERRRTWLVIEHCQEIAGYTCFAGGEDLFPQICFACALRFPQVPFRAYFRYEMTVSGAIQLFSVFYDGAVMHVQEKNGERPMDETDFSRIPVHDYAAENGVFRAVPRPEDL